MDKKKALPKSKAKEKQHYYTDTSTQNKRLLDALINAKGTGLTSYQVREELDIYCPTARITDLRKKGHNIVTIRETVDTGKAKHPGVARWVLVAQANEVAA